jgi:hypothetical protein
MLAAFHSEARASGATQSFSSQHDNMQEVNLFLLAGFANLLFCFGLGSNQYPALLFVKVLRWH